MTTMKIKLTKPTFILKPALSLLLQVKVTTIINMASKKAAQPPRAGDVASLRSAKRLTHGPLGQGRKMMKQPLKKGVSFGLTSGAITTLGLMVGLHSGTESAAVVLGGILTIAVADAFSDALGIHISEEGENQHAHREVWRATVATLLTKFVFAMSFLIPILLLPLSAAIIVSVTWGMSVLAVLSYLIAKNQGERPWKVIGEHVGVAALVIIIAHLLGDWIAGFGK